MLQGSSHGPALILEAAPFPFRFYTLIFDSFHLISFQFSFFKIAFVFPAPRAQPLIFQTRVLSSIQECCECCADIICESLHLQPFHLVPPPPAKSSVNTPSCPVQVVLAKCAAEWRTEVPDGTMSIDRLFDYTVPPHPLSHLT